MRQWMEKCTVAVSTDYTGIGVSVMTGLRRALRDKDIEYRVVKNRLAHLAADAANRPGFKEIISGPTGIAIGYGEPTDPAKTLSEYIRANRLRIEVRGGMLGDRALSAEQVRSLALLPSREELVSRLMGQLNAPAAGLVRVLNGPIAGLARVLQRHVENSQQEE
jgi:large subunit ribosomal protein L10